MEYLSNIGIIKETVFNLYKQATSLFALHKIQSLIYFVSKIAHQHIRYCITNVFKDLKIVLRASPWVLHLRFAFE